MDMVRFERGGRTFTVRLKDIERENSHSLNPLYLNGKVVLTVTRVHMAELMGSLRQKVSHRTHGTPTDAWVDAGGNPEDEPPGDDFR